jgi:Integrase core domain
MRLTTRSCSSPPPSCTTWGLRTLDRGFQLRRRRPSTAARNGEGRAGRQPGAVQPLRVPKGAPRLVPPERDRARGLQPTWNRPTPHQRYGRADRAAPRAQSRAGAAALVHLILNRRHLEHVLRVYVDHYNTERPHRALELRPPDPGERPPSPATGEIRRRDPLGGLIHEYYRAAA